MSIRFLASRHNRLIPALSSFLRGTLILLASSHALLSAAAEVIPAAGEDIVLGQSAPLSGPAAELGRQYALGAQAYFKMVNARGGVNGRQIRLVTLDDGYEPSRTATNTDDLLHKRGAFALFGYVDTPTTLAAMPMVNAEQVPMLAPLTGAAAFRAASNPTVFNVRASYADETRTIIDTLVGSGTTRIAVFYQDDAYGQSGLDGAVVALKRHGLAPVATGTVERNTTSVSDAVAKIAPANPQAVLLVSAYKSCAAFIREMHRRHAITQYWNVSFVGSNALSAELGSDGNGVAVSQVVPFPWGTLPLNTEFTRLVPKSEVGFTTLEGFIAAKVAVDGLRKAGARLTREGFMRALETASPIDVGGFTVRYDRQSRAGSTFVDTTVISNGRFIH